MLTREKDDVEGLFGRSLGLVDRIVFLLSFEDALKSSQRQSGGSLVAVNDGRIVGSVSVRFRLVGGRRTGFIDALVGQGAPRKGHRQIPGGRGHLVAGGAGMRGDLRHR